MPGKSKFSVFVIIALSAILLEISSTLVTCTSIIGKLKTKGCFNSFLTLTLESIFTLELEFARDIRHLQLTGPEKKLPFQHERTTLFVHAENTSKNRSVQTILMIRKHLSPF